MLSNIIKFILIIGIYIIVAQCSNNKYFRFIACIIMFVIETIISQRWDSFTDNYFTYGWHTYKIYSIARKNIESYDEAEDFCESKYGHLAVINSSEENDMLFDYVLQEVPEDTDTAHFGYSDEKNEGVWEWVDGSDSSYVNWSLENNQPNNGTTTSTKEAENYAEFYKNTKDGTWNDARWDKNAHYFICEWDNSIKKFILSFWEN